MKNGRVKPLQGLRYTSFEKLKTARDESNSLMETGRIHSPQNVYTEYPDLRRDEWTTKILPALKISPLPLLVKKSGLSRRALMDLRAGRSRPHVKNQERLAMIRRELGPPNMKSSVIPAFAQERKASTPFQEELTTPGSMWRPLAAEERPAPAAELSSR